VPTPYDLPLPLPGSRWLFTAALVFFFLAHLIFVNLMVGGTMLVAFFEGRGWLYRNKDDDRLARAIASTITVSKSLAVVLGVGPLLGMSLLYPTYFYTANILTGEAWILIIPLVIVAFLLLYLHKSTWDRWENRPRLHWFLGLLPLGLFLTVALIFITNVNLMLFPERWADVRGFLSAAFLPNVLPRYLHFLLASPAVVGLFLACYFGRRSFPCEKVFQHLTHRDLRRRFLGVAFFASLLQFTVGPVVLLTLPASGWSADVLVLILSGAFLALVALALLWREVRRDEPRLGWPFARIVLLLTGTVLLMGSGRHFYRETALHERMEASRDKTDAFLQEVAAAEREMTARRAAEANSPARLFQRNCSGCHAVDRVLVGPSLREVAELYKGQPDKIVAWAKNPGRRRENFRPMPTMAHVGEENLRQIAEYMLRTGSDAK
jgi:cytochrome c